MVNPIKNIHGERLDFTFHPGAPGAAQLVKVLAKDLNRSATLGHKAKDRPRQHRFAGARTADKAQNLASPHVEIEPLQHQLLPKAHDHIAHADRDLGFVG